MSALLTLEWLAWGKGLATSAGLIVAIGAQNAFLLTQSLKRQFHWPIALLCILFDALMISAGVAGLGVLISQSPLLLEVARWGGALFLLWFGYGAARRALSRNSPVHWRQRGSQPALRPAHHHGGDAAQPPRLDRYGGAARQHRRAVSGGSADLVRRGRHHLLGDLVPEPVHRRALAGTPVSSAAGLAGAGWPDLSDHVHHRLYSDPELRAGSRCSCSSAVSPSS